MISNSCWFIYQAVDIIAVCDIMKISHWTDWVYLSQISKSPRI